MKIIGIAPAVNKVFVLNQESLNCIQPYEGHSTPKILYIFGKNPFVFKKTPSKICKHPFVLQKPRALFQMSKILLAAKHKNSTCSFLFAMEILKLLPLVVLSFVLYQRSSHMANGSLYFCCSMLCKIV